jgi:hypothetical protein
MVFLTEYSSSSVSPRFIFAGAGESLDAMKFESYQAAVFAYLGVHNRHLPIVNCYGIIKDGPSYVELYENTNWAYSTAPGAPWKPRFANADYRGALILDLSDLPEEQKKGTCDINQIKDRVCHSQGQASMLCYQMLAEHKTHITHYTLTAPDYRRRMAQEQTRKNRRSVAKRRSEFER